jgi:hypothetical protein
MTKPTPRPAVVTVDEVTIRLHWTRHDGAIDKAIAAIVLRAERIGIAPHRILDSDLSDDLSVLYNAVRARHVAIVDHGSEHLPTEIGTRQHAEVSTPFADVLEQASGLDATTSHALEAAHLVEFTIAQEAGFRLGYAAGRAAGK